MNRVMNLADKISPPFEKPWGNYLLENIVETQAPDKINWLPQTLGWQLVAVALLIFAIKKSYQAYRKYQHNIYRRDALAWLTYCEESADIKIYQQLPALLRKTALNVVKRSDISQLNGKAWEQWLDQQCQQTNFVAYCPTLLQQLAFMPTTPETSHIEQYQPLLKQITLWVKYHKGLAHDEFN